MRRIEGWFACVTMLLWLVGGLGAQAAEGVALPPEVIEDDIHAPRTWTNPSGTQSAVATLIAAERGAVRLLKSNGREVRVPLCKLSTADQAWVQAHSPEQSDPNWGWAARFWNALDLSEAPAKIARQFAPSSETRQILQNTQNNAVHIQVSERFLNRFVSRERTFRAPITDVILGAQVHGHGRTVSQLRLDLIPSDRQAITDLLVTGRCDSQTTSFASPVQIHGHGVTVFSSRKRLIAVEDRILVLPAVTAARSRNFTDGITSSLPRLRGRISQRIAAREVAAQHGRVEAISARHAEQRVNQKIDELVGQWLNQMPSEMRVLLTRQKTRLPMRLVSHTSDDRLHVSLLPRNPLLSDELPPAPAVQSHADLVVQIHSPLLNTALSSAEWKNNVRRVLASTARKRIVQLVSTQAAAQPHWTLSWSPDHRWVTFAWSEKPRTQKVERQDQVATAR